MAVEQWVALASLGMFVLFTAQIISLSVFLENPSYDIDPSSTMREFLSISGGPALILAGSSFLLARRYGSRLCGSLIIAGGIIVLVGMNYVNELIPHIKPQYVVQELQLVPTIFMGVSIPVMVVGGLLFRLKPKPKRDYVFDR
ncbi:MAG TPA: hypothetical protein VJR22_06615 [Candidatus Nitrosotalea sp.]|nr:hypothetical protein [Nitrososphaerota archaeon]HKU33500.1 hypothetical protein [Candidatus Nitrosotalea sp.]